MSDDGTGTCRPSYDYGKMKHAKKGAPKVTGRIPGKVRHNVKKSVPGDH